jgi:very-short-patch-repair endonuclease
MSFPEVILWKVLKTRPAGLKFRRQQAAGPYVIDFFCHEAHLVIEVDGESHRRGDQPEFEAQRDAYFEQMGFSVLRIPAAEVLSDAGAAVQHIVAAAESKSPLHRPPAGPPPLKGRIG